MCNDFLCSKNSHINQYLIFPIFLLTKTHCILYHDFFVQNSLTSSHSEYLKPLQFYFQRIMVDGCSGIYININGLNDLKRHEIASIFAVCRLLLSLTVVLVLFSCFLHSTPISNCPKMNFLLLLYLSFYSFLLISYSIVIYLR